MVSGYLNFHVVCFPFWSVIYLRGIQPGDIWHLSRDISGCHDLGVGVLLMSSGQGPGVLLNNLQRPGQAATAKNYPVCSELSSPKRQA